MAELFDLIYLQITVLFARQKTMTQKGNTGNRYNGEIDLNVCWNRKPPWLTKAYNCVSFY